MSTSNSPRRRPCRAQTGIKAPGTKRFEHFRLVDRIRKGEASPQEILNTQDRFDNHFVDSPIWRQARAKADAAEHLVSLPSDGQQPY